MKRLEIIINGEAYPCSPTMGAMLRFREETGHEVTQMDGSLSELCTYLWCCVASACRREHRTFDYTLMDFADSISSEDVDKWEQSIKSSLGDSSQADEKKSL